MEDNSVLIKNFLEIPYDELERINLKAKQQALSDLPTNSLESVYRKLLVKETRIKAVMICFSDIEGRLHTIDYDKKYFLKESTSLTFDGSSIRGYSIISKSDLRLIPDWRSFRWLPSDVFGPGKVLLFASVTDQKGRVHPTDMRARLSGRLTELYAKDKMRLYLGHEIEGFLVEEKSAEQKFDERIGFQPVSEGGYYHVLPGTKLKEFIDKAAEAQRALGFENEKDHPEVASSQFELNYAYTNALMACDQAQLYKLICRQIAHAMKRTATFLPKPIIGINGSGMHTNLSLFKENKNLFYDVKGQYGMSAFARKFVSRLLNHANEICLILNSSVNSYRRLDPNFEAPNRICVSTSDRGAMIRLPMGTARSTRLEIRSVAPDCNPYLVAYTVLGVGLLGKGLPKTGKKRQRVRFLAKTINEALRYFKSSDLIAQILGKEVKKKYSYYKGLAAGRAPSALGTRIKNGEVLYHHEVTNQTIWNAF